MALDNRMSLPAIIEAVRGQRSTDYRPNKAMQPSRLIKLLDGYKHKELLVQIARTGIQPSWKAAEPVQTKPMTNHASARRYMNRVVKALRKGQDDGQYLVLDISVLKVWKNIQISPLGAIMKKDCDQDEEIRLIHDLSYSRGSSTNDMSRTELIPEIEYKHIAAVARRIVACHSSHHGTTVKLMKGDVKGAFRHLMLASGHARWMAATIREQGVLIIDMSAPFGWTSSPAFYGAFGGAISWLLDRECPASMDSESGDHERFFAYEWVDDHVLVEPDIGNRLHLAKETLRLAMLTILGPGAINEQKFSSWETKLQVLGLEFDTEARTISMPEAKIQKALNRVQILQTQRQTTKTQLQQVLGSLRHVCTCLRPAKPFYQNIHAACVRAPRYGKISVDKQIRRDLHWYELILSRGRLHDLPLAIYTKDQPVHIHLYMDSSNTGLAVLHPAMKQYIQLQFDEEEQRLIRNATGGDGFNINVREQLCVALAARVFGPTWAASYEEQVVVVKAWSDNTSAVAWTNRLSTTNLLAQEVNRAIGLAEAVYGFRIHCGHLPGPINVMADAGSRPSAPLVRKIYTTFSTTFNRTHWPLHQNRSTPPLGRGGQLGAQRTAAQSGYRLTSNSTRTSWRYSPSITGTQVFQSQERPSPRTSCCPLSTIFLGVICETEAMRSDSTMGTSWPYGECSGCPHHRSKNNPSHSPSYKQSGHGATSKTPTTAFSGGAAVVGFFFLLRRSEYLADGKRLKPYIIRTNDIKFVTNGGITTNALHTAVAVSVYFRGSKTDQSGVGTTRTLHRSGSTWLCPVLAAWELVQIARRLGFNKPRCSTGSDSVLSANALGDAIKKAASTIGADSTCFGTHSMRSGGATAMFAAGVDRLTIKIFGRWASDAFELYTRMNDKVAMSLAAQMTQGAQSRMVSPAPPEGLRSALSTSRTS